MVDDSSDKFSIVDYVIFSISLILSALVGLYYACSGGKQKTVGEYLFGDRNLKVFPVAMSIVASGTSAIGILAVTAEIYKYGSLMTIESLSILVFAPITAFIYLPLFYKLQLSSTYEYLERRFSKTVRRIATFIFLFQTQMYMSTCLYAPSSALSQVTGLTLWATVIGSSIVCIFYTVIGGLKAVVLTDTIQQALVIIGLLAVVIKGIIVMGGIESIWTISENGGRTQFLDWNPDPTYMYTTWTAFFGGVFGWLPFYAVDQCLVQRYLSLGTLKKAQQAIILTSLIYLSSKCLYLLTGWIVYARFSECDPKTTNRIERYDQILPLFVMESLSDTRGLPGLFVAAIYCASLSALSSGLTAMATVILEDAVKPISNHFWTKKYSEREEAFISKMIVLVFGGITLVLAFIIPFLGKTLFQISMSLYGITAGPFLAVFTLGMFFKWVHTWAAGSSIIIGVIFAAWLVIGSFIYPTATMPDLLVTTEGCNVTNFTHFTNYTFVPISYTSNIMDYSNTSNESIVYSNTTNSIIHNGVDFSGYEGINVMYRISYFHFPMLGFLVTLLCGFILSPLCQYLKKEIADPHLIYFPKQIVKDFFSCKTREEIIANGYKQPNQLTELSLNIEEIEHLNREDVL